MEKDSTLDVILTEQWSNSAYHDYIIQAVENCGFKPEGTKRVVRELH